MSRKAAAILRRSLARHRRQARPADALDDGPHSVLASVSEADRRIVERALPHSMTGVNRLVAAIDAVRYCVARDVPGAFIECGVWRGGSVIAMVLALMDMGVADRDVYLYDTFEGMTAPTERDVSHLDPPALDTWRASTAEGGRPWPWLFGEDVFDEADVRERVLSTGYPPQRLHFVRGRVEDTVPASAPGAIALLRLDTDWYESTHHELVHLYPRLSDGGVLIVDDYGHWQGSRQACDEYFAGHAPSLLLGRIDYAARMAIKH